jgi:ABC-type phosphate transport system substrate-binding protein
MILKDKFPGIVIPLCIMGLAFSFVSFSPAQEARQKTGVVAIVNADNPVPGLSLVDLRRMFKGKKKAWNNGVTLKFWLPSKGSDAMKSLVSKVFKYDSEEDLNKFYLIAIFQQKVTETPLSVKNDRDAAIKVGETKGGIALVSRSEVAGYADIKIIEVEGLSSTGGSENIE